MYSISSLTSGSQSSSSSSSKAIGGLVTGLDTAELIKGLTSSTRLKIARQKQNKQLLSWQTDAFRGVSNKLIEFSKKYTSFTSNTNLLSSSFYTKTDITTSGSNSSKVSVSGTSTMTDNLSIISATKASEGGAISTAEALANRVISGGTINFDNAEVSTVGGKNISIKYDGVDYNIKLDGTKYVDGSGNDDHSAFIADINNQLSKITVNSGGKLSDVMEFSLNSNKVTISNKGSKAAEIKEFSDELKTALGFEASNFTDGKISLSAGQTSPITSKDVGALTKDVDFAEELAGKGMGFVFNNSGKIIRFTKDELLTTRKTDSNGDYIKNGDKYEYDTDKFKSLFQTKLDSAFGKNSIAVSINGSNQLNFSTSNTGAVLKVSEMDPSAQSILNISAGSSNRLNLTEKLGSFGLTNPMSLLADGTNIVSSLNQDSTVQDLINTINSSGKGISVSYVESLDRFEFKSTNASDVTISGNIGEDGNIVEKLFVSSTAVDKTITIKAPKKAALTVQYGDSSPIDLESNNNTFNIDGLSINVNETFSTGDPVKLNAKTDTDKILTAVKDMVKDYNDIVDSVNKEYSTKPNREYAPLTDEQRSDMSESEIKVWEEKAKTGLLFGSSELSMLSSDLRSVFFSNKDALMALNAIGIDSSSDWKDNGKIIINEEKLKKAIESDPDNIKDLFTKSLSTKKDASGNDLKINGNTIMDATSGGVMARLKNLTDKYSKTEGSSKGILIEKAGNSSAPLSLLKNDLLDRMNSIDTMVKNLNTKLTAEQKRYQKQFTALETAYAKLNAQSGWLNQ